MSASASQQHAHNQVERGAFSKALSFLLEAFIWLLFALFFNVLVELAGIFFKYWDEQGALHSASMLDVELGWLNKDFGNVFGSPAESSVHYAKKFYSVLFVWGGYDLFLSMSRSPSFLAYGEYFEATKNMIYLFAMRLVVIVFSFPVFFVFGAVGLIDGLSQRDLRRFGGDRESSYFWNRIVRFIKPMFVLPLVIYLASPFSIHPNIVMLPFAFCFGITIWLSSMKFKKYL